MSKRILTCTIGFSALALLMLVLEADQLAAQARGARGGGGGRQVGNRPAMSRPGGHSPAMSRPANVSRPSAPNIQRPNPGGGGQRPNIGGGGAPKLPNPGGGGQRPNIGGGGAPKLPNPGGGNFQKPGGFQRPSTLPGNAGANRPNLPGGTNRPTTLPGNLPGGTNRPTTLPGNLPGKGERPNLPGNLPGKGERPNLPNTLPGNLPGQGNRPNISNRPNLPSSNQLNDFLGGGRERPATGINRPNIGNRGPNVAVNGNVNIGNRANVNYANNQKAWMDNRHTTGNVIRSNSGNRYWNAYNSGAYYRHNSGYNYRRGWASGYAWGTINTLTLRNYLGTAWVNAAPVYYAYGAGGNVYYEDNTVYVNDQPVGTSEQYYQQAQSLVEAAPEQTPETEEWLPLGVFALSSEDVEDSQMMVELAVNKQGVVAGTYYNQATGVSRPLKGTMDVKTQRAAIGFADGKNPEVVLETSVANLTEDEAPSLLHKGKDFSDPVLLVRLRKPLGAK